MGMGYVTLSAIGFQSPPAPIAQQRDTLRKPRPRRLVRDQREVLQANHECWNPLACAGGSDHVPDAVQVVYCLDD